MTPVVEQLKSQLSTEIEGVEQFRDNVRLRVTPQRLYELLQELKDKHGYDMLVDLTAADYLHYPDAVDRFGVVYALVNCETSERVYVKTMVNDPEPTLPSVF